MPDQVQDTRVKIETGKANPDHSLTFEDITAQIIMIHIEAALDHNTGRDTMTIEAIHNDLAQPTEDTATDLARTHHTGHITDHPNIKAHQVINPEITVDHIHTHPTDLQGMNLADQIHTSSGQEEGHIPRRA